LAITEFQMKKAREELDFGNDFYFVSQLFDEDWKPTDTA
jgi:sucrose-6-phosphate hydrolase SacC (GH32 family)